MSLHVFMKLLNLLCRKDGNPFNTTIAPSPAPASPQWPLSEAPVPSPIFPSNSGLPGKSAGITTTRTRPIIYAAIAAASLILAMLIGIICIFKWEKKLRHKVGIKHERLKGPISNANLTIPSDDIEKEGIVCQTFSYYFVGLLFVD